MLKALTWMFKVKKFEEHFLYLMITGLLFIGFVFILSMMFIPLCTTDEVYRVVKIILFVLLLVPFLHVTGYFWYMTDKIINRKEDISANHIYNGEIKSTEIIELPEIDAYKFLWRGFAAMIASVLLFIPFAIIFCLTMSSISAVAEFWSWTPIQASVFFAFLVTLISFIIPALLWNYARSDSVFAVWNIFVAVDIMGNYTTRYFTNAVWFLGYTILYAGIIKIVAAILGLSFLPTDIHGVNVFTSTGVDVILPLIILLVINYIVGTYWLFVNAYLLGTIAPRSEY